MKSKTRQEASPGRPGRHLGFFLVALAVMVVVISAGLPASGVVDRSGATAGAAVRVGGGLGVPGKPQLKGFTCLDKCVSPLRATPGARLRVNGAYLGRVEGIVFRAKEGLIRARSRGGSAAAVEVEVPAKAVSGKIYAVTGTGTRSNKSPRSLTILPTSAIPEEVFPVRGSFNYGSTGARFGAPRGGYSHQGQDVMASCGTGLVSIRRARVIRNTYQSAAGWYVVLKNIGTNSEFAYMHLQEKSRLKVGQRVDAGSPVGRVGQTGRAYGCHLHFEFWKGRWQMGGRPVDPLPYLRSLKRSR